VEETTRVSTIVPTVITATFGRKIYFLNILVTVLQFVTPQSHAMSSVGLGQGTLFYS
jgi:hypothetical protein